MFSKLLSRALPPLALLFEPAGLHLKAIVAGGLLFNFSWSWAALLALSLITFGALMVAMMAKHSVVALQSALEKIGSSEYWRRLPNIGFDDTDWKREIRIRLKLPTVPTARTVILTPATPDPDFLEPEAFVSAHSAAVIFLPDGFTCSSPGQLRPLKRFAVLHELAHSTKEGTLIWIGRRVGLWSAILAGGTLCLLPNGPPYSMTIGGIILLGLLTTMHLHSSTGKIAAELHADSQALEWIAAQSVDDALAVAKNRRIVWGKPTDVVFLQRCRNMVNWTTYLERLTSARLAVPPRITMHAIPFPWIQYTVAGGLFLACWHRRPMTRKPRAQSRGCLGLYSAS